MPLVLKMKGGKAQSSVEYIAILGFLLLTITLFFMQASDDVSTKIRDTTAIAAVEQMATTANEVYRLGPGSKLHVWIEIPPNVVDYVLKDNELGLRIQLPDGGITDVVKYIDANITGKLEIDKGTYKVPFEMLDSGTIIVGCGLRQEPSTLTYYADPGDSFVQFFNLTNACDLEFENLVSSVTGQIASWTVLTQPINTSLNLSEQTNFTSTITIPVGTATGTYTGFISVSGNESYSETPVTVIIRDRTAPTAYNGSPTGIIANETRPTISVNSDEAATCKGSIGGDETYENMDFTFSGSGLYHEYVPNTLVNGQKTVYVRCKDTSGNTMTTSYSWFFTVNVTAGGNGTLETEPPTVILNNPPNGNISMTGDVTFEYTPTDNSGILLCRIYINGTLNQTDTNVQEGVINTFSVTGLPGGMYLWSVTCVDYATNEGSSELRSLIVPVQVNVVFDDFESGDGTGGTGWSGSWSFSGNYLVDSAQPYEGSYALRLRAATGYAERCFDATTTASLNFSFYAKARSMEAGEENYFRVNPDGAGWTTLKTWVNGEDDDTYRYYSYDLTSYITATNLCIAFQANMSGNGDYFYVDLINGFGLEIPQGDNISPVIHLTSPDNFYVSSSTDMTFQYNTTDPNGSVVGCSLIIDGSIDQTDSTITEGAINQFDVTSLSSGPHSWSVNCTDDYANEGSSETRNFTILSCGLSGYWTFNGEGSGTAYDSAGSNDGTISGATYLASGGFDGDGAYSFDGNDYIAMGNELNTVLGTTSTLCAWIKTNQSGSETSWLAPGITGIEESGGGNDVFWGWIDAGGNIRIDKGNTNGAESTTAINNGTWYYTCFTRDSPSGSTKVYIDGTLEDTATSETGSATTSFYDLGRIDDTGGTPAYYIGIMDEVRIYVCALGDSEIGALYGSYAADVAPVVVLNSPNEGITTGSSSVTFQYIPNDDDSGIASCELIFDGSLNQTDITITEGVINEFTVTNIANGPHMWSVNCTDDSPSALEGQSGTRNFTVLVTNNAPTITLNSPPDGSTSITGDVTFQYTPNDVDSGIASCELIIDGTVDQTNSTITEGSINQFTKTGMTDGTYSWSVNCTDDDPSPAEGASETRSLTVSIPLEADCITIDSSGAYTTNGGKRLNGVDIQNTCGYSVTVTGAIVTWTGGSNIRWFRINGASGWSGNTGSVATLDFGANDVVIPASTTYETTARFSGSVNGGPITIEYIMQDASSKSDTFTV